MTTTSNHDTDPPPLRVTKGRRHEDYDRKNIEIHPVALSAVAGFFTIILSIAGYFFKGWADNMTTEIHLLRQAAEKQLSDTATNVEWRNSMSKWRDEVDNHFKDVDNRLDTLPWASPRRARQRRIDQQTLKAQIYEGGGAR